MSINAIGWAFDQDCRTCVNKLVLIKLADNANDHGQCWPSIAYIARHCNLSTRTVKRAIKSLADLNLIKIHHQFNGRIKAPSKYSLYIPMVTHSHQGSDRKSPRGVRQSPRVVTHSHIEPSGTVIEPKRQQAELKKIIDELALAKEWK